MNVCTTYVCVYFIFRETDYLKCVASLAKKVCDKGESFGQAVEEHVANLHSNVCSSAGTLSANYWKLLILILVGLFLKRSGAEISFFFWTQETLFVVFYFLVDSYQIRLRNTIQLRSCEYIYILLCVPLQNRAFNLIFFMHMCV